MHQQPLCATLSTYAVTWLMVFFVFECVCLWLVEAFTQIHSIWQNQQTVVFFHGCNQANSTSLPTDSFEKQYFCVAFCFHSSDLYGSCSDVLEYTRTVSYEVHLMKIWTTLQPFFCDKWFVFTIRLNSHEWSRGFAWKLMSNKMYNCLLEVFPC